MPSSHLILCRPLLFLPPIPPSIRVFGVIAHQITLQQKQKKNHPKTKGSSSEKPLSCGQQQPWRPGLGLAPATASPADVCPTGSFFPSRGLRPSQDAARPAREADRPSPAFTGEFCREHGHVRGSQRRGCPRAAHGPSRCAVEAAGLEGGFSGTGGLDPWKSSLCSQRSPLLPAITQKGVKEKPRFWESLGGAPLGLHLLQESPHF